jgi:hypothetical protein
MSALQALAWVNERFQLRAVGEAGPAGALASGS